MNILVNGIGNIGKTLLAMLSKHREILGVETIYALKNNPSPWDKSDLQNLQNSGVVICTRNQDDYNNLEDIENSIQYVFDCTNNGGGIKNKAWYTELPNLKGACAQGSEKSFGTSFMSGINNHIIQNEKFVHVVSCNTHSIATLVSSFGGQDLSNLEEADFVIVRRSDDIGNHERLVSANVVARHLDDQLGTHHSIDVLDLFKTIDIEFKVSSSDITTPSQMMHGVRFNLKLKNQLNKEEIRSRIKNNPFIAESTKFDSNVIFEAGRRNGEQGRIYSHAIIISNNMMLIDKNLIGWAFIPQEGNTILSTIHAFLLQTNNENQEDIMSSLATVHLRNEW